MPAFKTSTARRLDSDAFADVARPPRITDEIPQRRPLRVGIIKPSFLHLKLWCQIVSDDGFINARFRRQTHHRMASCPFVPFSPLGRLAIARTGVLPLRPLLIVNRKGDIAP